MGSPPRILNGPGQMSMKRFIKRLWRDLCSDLDADLSQIRFAVLTESTRSAPTPPPRLALANACDDEELRIMWARRAAEGVAFSARP